MTHNVQDIDQKLKDFAIRTNTRMVVETRQKGNTLNLLRFNRRVIIIRPKPKPMTPKRKQEK